MTLTNIKSVWYVESINTEILWSANGAMTDFAIFVTPIGWELVALPPPDTTLRANHVASATLRYSDSGSSETDKNRKTSVNKRRKKKKKKSHGTWAINVTFWICKRSLLDLSKGTMWGMKSFKTLWNHDSFLFLCWCICYWNRKLGWGISNNSLSLL